MKKQSAFFLRQRLSNACRFQTLQTWVLEALERTKLRVESVRIHKPPPTRRATPIRPPPDSDSQAGLPDHRLDSDLPGPPLQSHAVTVSAPGHCRCCRDPPSRLCFCLRGAQRQRQTWIFLLRVRQPPRVRASLARECAVYTASHERGHAVAARTRAPDGGRRASCVQARGQDPPRHAGVRLVDGARPLGPLQQHPAAR